MWHSPGKNPLKFSKRHARCWFLKLWTDEFSPVNLTASKKVSEEKKTQCFIHTYDVRIKERRKGKLQKKVNRAAKTRRICDLEITNYPKRYA